MVLEYRYTEADGIRTRFRDSVVGDRPVVLLHGGDFGHGAAADAWPEDFVSPLVDAGHRVVAIDRLGQGETGNPATPTDYRISRVVAHVIAVLDQLGIRAATIVGQSRGSFVATRVSFERPDIAERLILFNSGSMAPDVLPSRQPGTGANQLYFENPARSAREIAERLSYTTQHITEEWVAATESRDTSVKNVEADRIWRENHDAYYAELEAMRAETWDWLAEGRFIKPTLIIWGIGDATTSIEAGARVFSMFAPYVPHLRFFAVNECGHWPFREYPAEIASVTLQFIDREELR